MAKITIEKSYSFALSIMVAMRHKIDDCKVYITEKAANNCVQSVQNIVL